MTRQAYAETLIPAAGKTAVPFVEWKKLSRELLQYGAEMASGYVLGTGALITRTLDFDPEVVIIVNSEGLCWAIKTPTMAGDDNALFITDGTMTYITTQGITLGTKQFTLGTNADLNVSGEDLYWVALSGDGRKGSSREALLPAAGKEAVPYPTHREVVNRLCKNGCEAFFGTMVDSGGLLYDVTLPFDPCLAIVYNSVDRTWAIHTEDMPAAAMALFTQAGVMTYETTNGITFGAKTMRVGANGTLNTDNDAQHYLVLGKGQVGSAAEAAIPAAKLKVPYPTYIDVIRTLLAQGAELETGTVTGTGADIDIVTPFDPAAIILVNQTGLAWGFFVPSFTTADLAKMVTNGDGTFITTLGVTVGVKTFRIGADTDINVVAEVLHWVAIGSRPNGGSV